MRRRTLWCGFARYRAYTDPNQGPTELTRQSQYAATFQGACDCLAKISFQFHIKFTAPTYVPRALLAAPCRGQAPRTICQNAIFASVVGLMHLFAVSSAPTRARSAADRCRNCCHGLYRPPKPCCGPSKMRSIRRGLECPLDTLAAWRPAGTRVCTFSNPLFCVPGWSGR